MAIRSLVTRGFGNGTFNGTIGGVVLRGYISSTDNTGSKTTTLGGVSLTATGSVEVTGAKTTALGLTLTASGSVAIVGSKTTALGFSATRSGGVIGVITGSKTTTLDTVLLSATGSAQVTGAFTHTFGSVTLDAAGVVTDNGPPITTLEKRLQVNGPEYSLAISDPDKALTVH